MTTGQRSTSSTSTDSPVPSEVVLGVDTHGEVHVAAVVSPLGKVLGSQSFPATAAGYRRMLVRARKLGTVRRAGVEGTGTFGAVLSRYLPAQHVQVYEVNRPDRTARRLLGKSDPLDAQAAARAVLTGRARARAKSGDGPVHSARMFKLEPRQATFARQGAASGACSGGPPPAGGWGSAGRKPSYWAYLGFRPVRRECVPGVATGRTLPAGALAKDSAVKARTQAVNQLKAVMVIADPALRERLSSLGNRELFRTCARFSLREGDDEDAVAQATRITLSLLAQRIEQLTGQIDELKSAPDPARRTPRPAAAHAPGYRPGQRRHSTDHHGRQPRAAAHRGVLRCPVRSQPHRVLLGPAELVSLNHGGDRQANAALHRIVFTRLRHDPRTQAYYERRSQEGKTPREIIRCLKRYAAREVFNLVRTVSSIPRYSRVRDT